MVYYGRSGLNRLRWSTETQEDMKSKGFHQRFIQSTVSFLDQMTFNGHEYLYQAHVMSSHGYVCLFFLCPSYNSPAEPAVLGCQLGCQLGHGAPPKGDNDTAREHSGLQHGASRLASQLWLQPGRDRRESERKSKKEWKGWASTRWVTTR